MIELIVAVLCTFGTCTPAPVIDAYGSVAPPARYTPVPYVKVSPCIATDLNIGTHSNGNPCSN